MYSTTSLLVTFQLWTFLLSYFILFLCTPPPHHLLSLSSNAVIFILLLCTPPPHPHLPLLSTSSAVFFSFVLFHHLSVPFLYFLVVQLPIFLLLCAPLPHHLLLSLSTNAIFIFSPLYIPPPASSSFASSSCSCFSSSSSLFLFLIFHHHPHASSLFIFCLLLLLLLLLLLILLYVSYFYHLHSFSVLFSSPLFPLLFFSSASVAFSSFPFFVSILILTCFFTVIVKMCSVCPIFFFYFSLLI